MLTVRHEQGYMQGHDAPNTNVPRGDLIRGLKVVDYQVKPALEMNFPPDRLDYYRGVWLFGKTLDLAGTVPPGDPWAPPGDPMDVDGDACLRGCS